MQAKMQSNRYRELFIAFGLIILITIVYAFVVLQLRAIPVARGLFGHSIGVLGFILMMMTETFYSLRKRSMLARWGRLSSWLEAHIIMGIVGPYMVLLHTSWKFNGLAGVLMLMTIIVVASGFLGRYIYTSIPRTADGAEMENADIERLIADLEVEINAIHIAKSDDDTRPVNNQANEKNLKRLIRRRRILQTQMTSLATARRMMSLWHTIHIPLGMVVFTTAFFHIIAAIYYATLIR
jgi:hypothetical protein